MVQSYLFSVSVEVFGFFGKDKENQEVLGIWGISPVSIQKKPADLSSSSTFYQLSAMEIKKDFLLASCFLIWRCFATNRTEFCPLKYSYLKGVATCSLYSLSKDGMSSSLLPDMWIMQKQNSLTLGLFLEKFLRHTFSKGRYLEDHPI